MSLAQPGLPSCWLEAQACESHPHFGPHHAASPHTHDYLFDLTLTSAAQGLPIFLIPLSLLIEILLLSLLLRGTANSAVFEQAWFSPLEPPPPRALLPS